jgi:hypothetical protein
MVGGIVYDSRRRCGGLRGIVPVQLGHLSRRRIVHKRCHLPLRGLDARLKALEYVRHRGAEHRVCVAERGSWALRVHRRTYGGDAACFCFCDGISGFLDLGLGRSEGSWFGSRVLGLGF